VIDVTRRSVEETAAAIFQLYQGRRNRRAGSASKAARPEAASDVD
jgi:hypothetical protein